MGSALEVTDSLSNTEEQIERAARTIGHSKVEVVPDSGTVWRLG